MIPLIDALTAHLEKAIKNTALLRTVRNAAVRGRAVLNKYYSRTDDSIMYRCAMSKYIKCLGWLQLIQSHTVLHPTYKLEYFREHGWESEWIPIAEKILREQWVTYYQEDHEVSEAAPTVRTYHHHVCQYTHAKLWRALLGTD